MKDSNDVIISQSIKSIYLKNRYCPMEKAQECFMNH